MIIFLIILLVLCAVFEMISLNTSFQNIRFEFRADRKSTEPDEPFYMIEKASNLSRLPVTYLKPHHLSACHAGFKRQGVNHEPL